MRIGILRRTVLVMLFAILASAVAFGQGVAPSVSTQPIGKKAKQVAKSKGPIKVTTELGLGVGAQYKMMKVVPISPNFTPKMTSNVSFGAALQFRLNIGKTFGIQPEVCYSYSNIRIDDKASHNFTAKARLNLVQMPILVSFRIAMFRINFGPVFTLMDNPTYNIVNGNDAQQMFLSRIYPTITYAAGVSVKFAGCMMVDVRYSGQFMDIKHKNEYVFSLENNPDNTPKYPSQKFYTRNSGVQVRFGYVF